MSSQRQDEMRCLASEMSFSLTALEQKNFKKLPMHFRTIILSANDLPVSIRRSEQN